MPAGQRAARASKSGATANGMRASGARKRVQRKVHIELMWWMPPPLEPAGVEYVRTVL